MRVLLIALLAAISYAQTADQAAATPAKSADAALPESKAASSSKQNLEEAQKEGADIATQMAKLDAEQQELQKKMSANQKQQADLGDAYTKAVTADAETKKRRK